MLKFKQIQVLQYSVFPKTNLCLKMDDRYKKIIENSTPFLTSEYKTIIDFLFCEIFTQWKKNCMDFYYNNGPKMTNDPYITQKEINAFDTILTEFVLGSLLTIDFENHTWDEFKVTINDLIFA